MASSSPSELYANIQSALQCITDGSSPPSTIKQAQDALLQWEATNTDEYVMSLISLVGLTSDNNAAAATLRLIAVLTLKSAIVRRWKNRGRGRVGAPQILLSDAVKTYIRQSLLNLVLTGKIVDNNNVTQPVVFITNPNEISMQQVELLQDKPLQTNAASLLSKIARMDLPLKFHELIPTLVEGMKCSRGVMSNLIIQQQQQLAAVVVSQQQQQQQIQIFQTILYNTMHCLEEILSEISTQRLLVDKKYRNSLAIQYLGSIVEFGLIPSLQAVDSLRRGSNNASSEGAGGEEEFHIIQYATLTSKVVSHLMTSSFTKLVEDPSTTPLVDQTLTLIHSFLSTWLPNVLDHDNNNNHNNDTLRKPMKELLLVHCELIVELQDSVEFMRYVKPFLDLFHTSLVYIVSNNEKSNVLKKSSQYTIAILSFLSNVVGETKYVNPDSNNELTAFFTPGVIQSLASTLLLLFSIHIYPDNQNDIGQDDNYDDDDGEDDDAAERVQWQDDPEGFYQYENQRSSDDDIGCASQNLFLSLVESSFTAKVVIPWLTELLTNVVSQRLAVELEGGISSMGQGVTWEKAIMSALPLKGALGTSSTSTTMQGEDVVFELLLQWDAIFAAAGLVGGILERSPGFDFQSWFDSSLGPCLSLILQSKSQKVREEKHLDQNSLNASTNFLRNLLPLR